MTHADANDSASIDQLEKIDQACDAFEKAFRNGESPSIEAFISEHADVPRSAILKQLLHLEIELRSGANSRDSIASFGYAKRFPDDGTVVKEVVASFNNVHASAGSRASGRTIQIRCPNCQNLMDLAIDSSFMDIDCAGCGSRFNLVDGNSGSKQKFEATDIDKFTLIERIGIGSFGTVWRAHDNELDRDVAIKIPRRGNLQPEDQQKFLREARAAAQLEHPNIVSVHAVGRDAASDSIYIVSDVVHGLPLSKEIAEHAYSPREATIMCETIAHALSHAHDQGVIHRDLKPHNILIDADNKPHITDFGLAKRETGEVTMTLDGQLLGTPAYMPPEQAAGTGHQADGRADIYSLGVILFQMLTGELPFRGNLRMLIHQVMYEQAPSPRRLNSNISRDLETICLKCLEKDPGKRYQTAEALAVDLGRTLRNEPILARPVGWPTRAWRWCQRNSMVAILAATIVATLTGGLIVTGSLASRLSKSDKEKSSLLVEKSSLLVEKSSLLVDSLFKQLRLLRESRNEGYLSDVLDVVRQLESLDVDDETLRKEVALALGDFVGLQPVVHNFPADVRCFAVHPNESLLAVGLSSGRIHFVHALTKELTASCETGAPVLAMRFDENGRLLFISGRTDDKTDGRIVALTPKGDVWEPEFQHPIDREFEFATFTRDGSHVTIWSSTDVDVVRVTDNTNITSVSFADIFPPPAEDTNLDDDKKKEDSGQSDKFVSVAFCPSHQLLAIGYLREMENDSESGLVAWSAEHRTTKKRVSLTLDGGYANSMAFSESGNELVYGTDRGLLVFEVPTFERRSTRFTGTNKAVDISSDDQYYAAVDMQGNVTISSVKTGNTTARLTFPIHESYDEWIAFSDHQRLLVASDHEKVKVWHLRGADERRLFPSMTDAVPTVAFSPNEKWLAIGSKDKAVAVLDAVSGTPIARMETAGEVQSVRFSPDSAVLAIAYRRGGQSPIELWHWTNGSFQLFATAIHTLDRSNRVAFTSDQHIAAICDNGIAVWNYANCDRLADKPTTLTPIKIEQRQFGDRTPGGTCRWGLDLCVPRNGSSLVWTEFNKDNKEPKYELRDWDWMGDSPSRTLNSPRLRGGWHSTDVVGESNKTAFITRSGQMAIWDIATNQQVALLGDKDAFSSPNVAVSADGKWAAGLSTSESVSIWDIATGKEILSFRQERSLIYSLDWNGNSQLAIGLGDGGVVVWDITKAREKLKAMRRAVRP